MRRSISVIFMFLILTFAVSEPRFAVAASYEETGTAKNNFKPAKRAMSFIEFSNVPENYGMRDMRSLRKRYARYRSGTFLVKNDVTDCVDCKK